MAMDFGETAITRLYEMAMDFMGHHWRQTTLLVTVFFKFLSDPSPIIDLPCQSVSHLFTVLFDKQPIHAIFYRIVPSQTYAEDKVFWRLWSYVLMPEQNKSHVIDAENKTKAVLFGAGTKQKSCWWCRNKIKAICHGGKKWSAQFSRYFRPV